MKSVKVNAISGETSFEHGEAPSLQSIKKGIGDLGYQVVDETMPATTAKIGWLSTYQQKFLFCLPFTLVLMSHMLPFHWHWLMNPWVQLAICLPVFVLGMWHFGRSAWKSITKGVPNMNVLIAIGALAAFVYSLYGAITNNHQLIFFETTASIITLVLLGNLLEDWTHAKTQTALQQLTRTQTVMANMIAYDDKFQEQVFPVEAAQLRVGDLVLIKTGEMVPQDCKILSGDVLVNEAIVSGESKPIAKKMNEILIGGSVLESGNAKAYVSAVGEDSVQQKIVRMMQQAQMEKPPMQQLADKISAVFVPVVIGLAVLCLLLNYFVLHTGFTGALLRSIAVLVISCPCAMGLATPAAIAVGLGRAARNGILFKNAKGMERFQHIRQVVFDKTGTLTTGKGMRVAALHNTGIVSDTELYSIIYSLEKFSNHPIGQSLAAHYKTAALLKWQKVEEQKGVGMVASDKAGHVYRAVNEKTAIALAGVPAGHAVYVLQNNQLLATIDLEDELRPEAKQVIDFFKAKGIKTILLSGDRKAVCEQLASQLGIEQVFAEQTPDQKLQKMAELNAAMPTVMVGDGINDAPALAKANIGISLGEATQLAIQSADVLLLKNGLQQLPMSLGLGRATYGTIKSNLFWAFAYNIVAIPVAAFGLLTPTLGALVMGLSDVVLAANSLWLNWKKVE